MKFYWKAIILYLSFLVISTFINSLINRNISYPSDRSVIFALFLITWIGINDLMEAK